MEFKRLKYDLIDGIATITLNRPDKLNAFDFNMFTDISLMIDKLAKDKTLRVVIVTGEGSDFSSGLDIKSVLVDKKSGFRLLWKWWPGLPNLAQKMSVGWRKLPVPVIMAIQGRCWGAGLQTALGGDFRIGSPNINLSIMESHWGLIPDMGGALALREIVSMDKALDWAMTARQINADEALKYGLITRIDEKPLQAAQEFARQLCEKSPDSLAATKKLFQYAWHHNDHKVLAQEWRFQWKLLLGKNRVIAVAKGKGKKDVQFLPRSF